MPGTPSPAARGVASAARLAGDRRREDLGHVEGPAADAARERERHELVVCRGCLGRPEIEPGRRVAGCGRRDDVAPLEEEHGGLAGPDRDLAAGAAEVTEAGRNGTDRYRQVRRDAHAALGEGTNGGDERLAVHAAGSAAA